jgi:non-specific serine/threonine protein kinase
MEMFEHIGDRHGVALTSYHLGVVSAKSGDRRQAHRLLEAARTMWEADGDEPNVAFALAELGHVSRMEGNADEARELLELSLQRLDGSGIKHGLGLVLCELGFVALMTGDLARAQAAFRAALDHLRRQARIEMAFSNAIQGIAHVALRSGDPRHAVELFAAVSAWSQATGFQNGPAESRETERSIRQARRHIGDRAFDEAWRRGHRFSITHAGAVAFAFAEQPIDAGETASKPVGSSVDRLTPQERRVLCLMVDGNTNRQIAAALGVSIRTVTTHTDHIFGKLAVDNRTQAVAIAIRHAVCER